MMSLLLNSCVKSTIELMGGSSSGDSVEDLECFLSDTDTCDGMESSNALVGGQSVKEIDEQLSSLKKENFNLKLRIYYLEERIDLNFATNEEDIMKKNIELQVELASLQTELEDKQELLCQAAKAMEIEEEENKKEICIRNQEIHDLKDILEHIQYELKNEKEAIKQVALCAKTFDLNVANQGSLDIVKKFQVKAQELQEQLKNERDRTGHFNMIAETVREKCKSLEMQILEKNHEIATLTTITQEAREKLTMYEKRIQKLEEMLLEKTVAHEEATKKLCSKDEDFLKQKLSLENVNKLFSAALEEKSKLEKLVEKYRWQCCISEKKNEELLGLVDTLKNKSHTFEVRLSSSLNQEVNKSLATPRLCESTSKTSSKSGSFLNFAKSFSLSNNVLFCDVDEIVSPKTHRNNKIESFTQEYVLKLRKNHFKACTIITTMIHKKKEYLEQIDKLQKCVADKGNEIKSLKKMISDLSAFKPCASGKYKKSIKDKVSELNLTASLNSPAAKDFWIFGMNSNKPPFLQNLQSTYKANTK